MSIDAALARNRIFAAAGGHEAAPVLPSLGLLVITCVDPRVDPAHFLGLDLGDAIVLRSAGARVTPEVVNQVAFLAQLAEHRAPEGPPLQVAVIAHTQCGTALLAEEDFRSRYAARIGASEESTLRELAVVDAAATVAHDVELLRNSPAISPRIAVSGHVYDVASGLVETIL